MCCAQHYIHRGMETQLVPGPMCLPTLVKVALQCWCLHAFAGEG